MDTMNQVQILNEVVCFSHSAKTIKNGMNPTILPPAMDKQKGRLGFLT